MIKDTDFGSRDKKGNWKPFEKIIPMPRYIIPFKPIKLFLPVKLIIKKSFIIVLFIVFFYCLKQFLF